MRTMAIILLVAALVLPVAVSAQGMMGAPWNFRGPGMMQAVEEKAVGNQTYWEMDALMDKMMAGTLNASEQDRLVSLMNQYPGPYGMMWSGMMTGWATGASPYSTQSLLAGCGPGTFGVWTSGFWIFMILVCIVLLVWLIVGILLILYLARKLSKN